MSDKPTDTIQVLRAKAAGMGLPISRDMGKEVLAKMITDYEQTGKVIFGSTMGNQPPVGYARVIVHKSGDARASNTGVFASVNGLPCLIQQGVEADIPIKILRGSLITAVTTLNRYNENERDPDKRFYDEDVYSYPFTVLAVTEGQDPKHYQHERNQASKNRNKKIFWRVHGYYPKPKELREWIAGGGLEKALIELKERASGKQDISGAGE